MTTYQKMLFVNTAVYNTKKKKLQWVDRNNERFSS